MASDEHPLSHPRDWPTDVPASGAWKPGDPVGNRQFVELFTERPMMLEGGESLGNITCAYETWGTLSPTADNAVLVCHALTGESHAAGQNTGGPQGDGWWKDLIGPGLAIDTNRYFVVCANVLGGCQGTTGPASINPATGKPFGAAFPTVSIRDIVRVQASMATHLGIETWMGVVGGSMGGMQVLEWALMYPDRVRSIAPIATTLGSSAWQISWSAVGRMIVALDPKWNGGDYYDAAPGQGPHVGFAIARSLAQITYRSDEEFESRFGRSLVEPHQIFGSWDRFQVESYLDYHGVKLARRFDANSYLTLNKAMDLHDVARNRQSRQCALERLTAPVLTMSISSDTLYHPYQQQEIHDLVTAVGGHSEYHVVESPFGHDGFLVEGDAVGAKLGDFLERVHKGDL